MRKGILVVNCCNVVTLLALLVGGLPALAQLSTGTILGTVEDASGSVLGGATVYVTNVDQNLTRTAKTGQDGAFRFPVLPVGNYRVQATHEGFSTETRTGLVLTVNQDAVVTFTLQVGKVNETVKVAGDAIQVDTTNATLGTLVNEQKIEDLPLNGRNLVDLTLLQPGVSQHTNQVYTAGMAGTIFSVDGAPIRSNNFTLDGAIMENFYGVNSSSVNSTTLGAEGIREYQVITNLAPAEYGLTMGSQTIMVSKSGSNQTHGSLYDYLRNSALDARNYFDELYSLPSSSPEGGARIAPFRRNQFGASLGRPIKKDKTFFFADFEGVESVEDDPISSPLAVVFPQNCYSSVTKQLLAVNNPCASFSGGTVAPVMVPFLPLYPYPDVGNNEYAYLSREPLEEYRGQLRVDQNFSSKDTFFTRYTADDATVNLPYSYPQTLSWEKSRNQYLTLAETHIFSPTLINMASLSYSRTSLTTWGYSGAGPAPDLSFIPGEMVGLIAIGNSQSGEITTWGPAVTAPSFHGQNIDTLIDNVFWTKGKHALKFGFLGNRYGLAEQETTLTSGLVIFPSIPTFLAGDAVVYLNNPTDPQNSNHYWRFRTFGFYGQDDYRVSRRLTLNLGLRYEFFTVPNDMEDRQWRTFNIMTASVATTVADAPAAGWTQGPIIRNPSLKNFSPRIGFAGDVFGDGKTAVRGGGGIYYDVASDFGALFVYDTLGTPPLTASSEHVGFGTITIPLTYLPTDVSSGVTTVNYYANQPYLGEWDLSIQRELPGNIALTAAYVGNRGIHLMGGPASFPNPTAPLSVTNGVPIFPTPETTPQLCPNGACPRLNPNLGSVTQVSEDADAYYNALQVTAALRTYHGLQFQASYTWASAEDDVVYAMGSDTNNDGTYLTNPFDGRTDRGLSNDDLKNNLRASCVYHLPNMSSSNLAAGLLKGWFVGTIVSLQSGYPYSPLVSGDYTNLGAGFDGAERPNLVTSANLAAAQQINPNAVVYNPKTVTTKNPNQWFNPNMYTVGAPGTLGNAGRDNLIGPGLADWDFSLNKDTKLRFLGEGGTLEFRAESFNILNRSNFATTPNNAVISYPPLLPTVGAGEITSTVTNSRQIQFALRVQF